MVCCMNILREQCFSFRYYINSTYWYCNVLRNCRSSVLYCFLFEFFSYAANNLLYFFWISLCYCNQEFITAISAYNSSLRNALLQYLRYRLKNVVSCRMSVCIVIFFEIIYIYYCYGKRLLQLLCFFEFRSNMSLDASSVINLRQLILLTLTNQHNLPSFNICPFINFFLQFISSAGFLWITKFLIYLNLIFCKHYPFSWNIHATKYNFRFLCNFLCFFVFL